MKFQLGKEEIAAGITACKSVLLFDEDALLRIRVKGGKVSLSSSGGGAGSLATYTSTGPSEDGEALVSLATLLRFSIKDAIKVALKENAVRITAGRVSYLVPLSTGNPADVEMPEDLHAGFQISTHTLREAVKAVWFGHDASGSGDIRFIYGKKRFLAETADEYRGGYYMRQTPGNDVPIQQAVVPKKTADALLSSFDKNDDVVLSVIGSALVIWSGDRLVRSPLVTDSRLFPVFKTIKRTLDGAPLASTVQVDAKAVGDALNEAVKLETDKARLRALAVEMGVEKGARGTFFYVRASGYAGEFQSRVAIDKQRGKSFKIKTDAKALKDLLAVAVKISNSLRISPVGEIGGLVETNDSAFQAQYLFKSSV